jgi:hypothetical protein
MFITIFSIFLFAIIIYFILVITIGRKKSEEFDEQFKQQTEQRKQKQNILIEYDLIHLNGHPYLQINDTVLFQIRNNNTIYFYKENNNANDEIPISHLKRYEIKTETEISKDVTLTRLFALGIFAFGVKKRTKTEEQYLILSYTQNGVEVNCLFKRWYQGMQLGDIISTITRLKIEENKGKECVI